MGFKKAFQHMPKPEGYEDYVQALLEYKEACSVYKRLCQRLEGKYDPASRLARADAKDVYSHACKVYTAERLKYTRAIAVQRLAERGVKIDIQHIMDIAGIEIPLTMKDMIEAHKKEAMLQLMTGDQFEEIRKAALAHPSMQRGRIQAPRATKDSFLAEQDTPDPTFGDFEPL
jgi:hypothetical protein